MSAAPNPPPSPLHRSAAHESAALHVTGEARYIDDLPLPPGGLVAALLPSPVARGRIVRRDASAARALPGVHAILFAADIPGGNNIGPMAHDEPVLAEDEVFAPGQAVALVVGESLDVCRRAIARIVLEIDELPAIFDIPSAIEAGAFLTTPHVIQRGDVAAALAAAAVVVEGELETGGQDHFYLETHVALAIPGEAGTLTVLSSTQHPSEVQADVAHVLGLGRHEVVVQAPRMGGAFGGKESQASNIACLAALGARATGRPVRLWLNRDQDMSWTGNRHPFRSVYRAGFDADGRLQAFDVRIWSNGGWSVDLSGPVLDRALFHLDSSYFIPHVRFEGLACRTNLPSNTAFRGFGGPQGMIVVEDAITRYAERRGLDPAEVRGRSYYGPAPRDVAPYGQVVPDVRSHRIHEELLASCDYDARRRAIEELNGRRPHNKRGIGFQPVKFGISFTNSVLNQAGALVHVYCDGSVQINHGGTEMGQGLHTKMQTVCAHELGVDRAAVRVMTTSTDKVPNTVATAASSGSDLNGQAVHRACAAVRDRMAVVAAGMLGLPEDRVPELVFAGGVVGPAGGPSVRFADVAGRCFVLQVSLSSTGFYRTPGIAYDRDAGQGKPFHYYAFGGAVTEVEISGLTGELRVLRVDVLHDAGSSLVPSIDRGQVEGGYIQGLGWLTCEELRWDAGGHLLTASPSTYKVPAVGEAPLDFRVRLLDRAEQPGVIHGSKAVGEPPFMLAISALTAIRHAVSAFGRPGDEVHLGIPATPESILRAVEDLRARRRS